MFKIVPGTVWKWSDGKNWVIQRFNGINKDNTINVTNLKGHFIGQELEHAGWADKSMGYTFDLLEETIKEHISSYKPLKQYNTKLGKILYKEKQV